MYNCFGNYLHFIQVMSCRRISLFFYYKLISVLCNYVQYNTGLGIISMCQLFRYKDIFA